MAARVMHYSKCIICGDKFGSWYDDAKTCSEECWAQYEENENIRYDKLKEAEEAKTRKEHTP